MLGTKRLSEQIWHLLRVDLKHDPHFGNPSQCSCRAPSLNFNTPAFSNLCSRTWQTELLPNSSTTKVWAAASPGPVAVKGSSMPWKGEGDPLGPQLYAISGAGAKFWPRQMTGLP